MHFSSEKTPFKRKKIVKQNDFLSLFGIFRLSWRLYE